jgi:outer membrane receptor for ferrienterochelin and colicins
MSATKGTIIGCGLAVFACGATAVAQDIAPAPLQSAAEGVTTTGNTVVYGAAYSARFEPNNAEDMLRRIPGVPAILDGVVTQQERGFGSAGAQILLNGRRFPGKANEINTTLRRIAATNVERVELISGTSGAIKVQSQGLVVNLVLRPGASVGGSGNWELNARSSEKGHVNLDGLAAYNGAAGALSYGFGVERNLWSPPSAGAGRWSYRTRDEIFWNPDGTVQELRPQAWRRSHDKLILTGNLAYDFVGGDRVTLNALYESREAFQVGLIPYSRYAPAGALVEQGLELQAQDVNDVNTLEIGGEYVSSFGPGDFTGLFIVRRVDSPAIDYRLVDRGGRIEHLSRNESLVERGEDIVRGSYVFPLATGQSLEVGAEGARNTLHQELISFRSRNGALEQVQVPGDVADPRVKELRGEAFAVFKWQASAALSLDASLNYEYSELTTNYPAYPTRELGFLKPRVDARYKFGPRDQLRILVERTVSQLDFANFVPRYNVDDQLVESGNPALEPEKVWTAEVGYEHRLARDAGLIELRAFHDDIGDAIDRVPFCRVAGRLEPVAACFGSIPAGRLDSAFGNIASAREYGVEAKASLRLGFMGLDDAVLSLRGLRRWSDIDDPFTGLERRLGSDRKHEYDVQFRHDLTAWRMSYGFTYKSLGVAAIQSDLAFTNHFEIEPMLEAFVERRLTNTLTLRAELQNLTHSYENRSRYLWNLAAGDGQIQRTLRRVEFFEERRDIRGALRLRGRF